MPELDFKGKEFVYNHHLAVPHRPLIPGLVHKTLPAGLSQPAGTTL